MGGTGGSTDPSGARARIGDEYERCCCGCGFCCGGLLLLNGGTLDDMTLEVAGRGIDARLGEE